MTVVEDADGFLGHLRFGRARAPGARLRDGLGARSPRGTQRAASRERRDAAPAAGRRAETAMRALRNVDQRLMVENDRLIAAAAPEPTRTAPAARALSSLPPTDL